MAKKYRILLDRKIVGKCDGVGYIDEEGAKILWEAYCAMFLPPNTFETMERREERGGICWLSEIKLFKDKGILDNYFNWTHYQVP